MAAKDPEPIGHKPSMEVDVTAGLTPGTAPAQTDTALMALSIVNREAFVGIFDRHYEAVHRYLHRRLGHDLADDLAAETFLRAFAARRSFEQRSDSALPWLYGIASNLVRRHRRTEERRRAPMPVRRGTSPSTWTTPQPPRGSMPPGVGPHSPLRLPRSASTSARPSFSPCWQSSRTNRPPTPSACRPAP